MLPFNNRDWVFANGHQIATSGQFQESCAVMQTECQIGLSAAAAIMHSYCHWHILQEKKTWSESRFSCVTLYCVQSAIIWKLPRPCGKWHFPEGWKKISFPPYLLFLRGKHSSEDLPLSSFEPGPLSRLDKSALNLSPFPMSLFSTCDGCKESSAGFMIRWFQMHSGWFCQYLQLYCHVSNLYYNNNASSLGK